MDNQKLRNWFDFVVGNCKNHLDPCWKWDKFDDEVVAEIYRLIELNQKSAAPKEPLLTTGRNPKEILSGMRQLSHSGEAEVGDEGFTEQILAWFNSFVRWGREHDREWHEGDDEAVKTIRALLRQQRTVSREWVINLAAKLHCTKNPYEVRDILIKSISELGFSVEEKEKT